MDPRQSAERDNRTAGESLDSDSKRSRIQSGEYELFPENDQINEKRINLSLAERNLERVTRNVISASDQDTRIVTVNDEIKFDELLPNTKYEKNGYVYVTNDQASVKSVFGKLELKDGGRSSEQTQVGHLGFPTDEGGHLIGSRFNGPTDGFNLIPQDANLNRGEWKSMENEWAKALDRKHTVQVLIDPVYDGVHIRPVGFEVIYQFDLQNPNYRFFFNERSQHGSA